LNWDIVDAMSTVKELVLSPDGIVLEPLAAADEDVADAAGVVALDELDELGEDEQPAAAKAATTATPAQRSRGKRLPPSLLLLIRIPTPFTGISHGAHRTSRASLQGET
jgi:hypothetical protein